MSDLLCILWDLALLALFLTVVAGLIIMLLTAALGAWPFLLLLVGAAAVAAVLVQ